MKTKKNALIVLCAIAISTVSCVDDTVSPQVDAIRTQQVESMKAKAIIDLAAAEKEKTAAEIIIADNKVTLATKVAGSGDDLAKEYYRNYGTEVDALTLLYTSRITLQKLIITQTTTAGVNAATNEPLVKSTKDLEAINVKITAQEKIVAYWKGLLDKIFTA